MDRTEEIKTYIESHIEDMRNEALKFYMDNIKKYFNDEIEPYEYYIIFNINEKKFEVLNVTEIRKSKMLVLFNLGYGEIKDYNNQHEYNSKEEWISATEKKISEYNIPFYEQAGFKEDFEKLGTKIRVEDIIIYE